MSRRFRKIIKQEAAGFETDATQESYPRHHACVTVNQDHLDAIINIFEDVGNEGAHRWARVWLVSVEEQEIVQGQYVEGSGIAAVSLLFPRVYSCLEIGWEACFGDVYMGL
jgi:hypothetical protein